MPKDSGVFYSLMVYQAELLLTSQLKKRTVMGCLRGRKDGKQNIQNGGLSSSERGEGKVLVRILG